jgi:putative ABC transport system permease protein
MNQKLRIMSEWFNWGTFFKFLGKNRTYTFIDIFGLAVSLMFVILIAVYTVQELSTDQFQENAERMYILGNEETMENAYRIGDRILERYPEIEKACPVIPWFESATAYIGENKLKVEHLLFAGTDFFSLFSFKLHGATPDQVLSTKNYAVVSRTFARKAFGDTDPLGQTIKLSNDLSVTVNGVMDDIKNSVLPYSDIIVRIDNIKHFNETMDRETFDNAGGAYLFLLEKEGTDLKAKAADMANYFKEIFWTYRRGISNSVTFIPLKDAYFSDIRGYNLRHGEWKLVLILLSAGLLILLFAVINYINLTVAQAGFRAKEMAMRRLLGSGRQELFVRLIIEAIFLCLISFLLALLLAALCVPCANTLLQTKLYIAGAVSPASILITAGIIGITGIIAGWVPATIISRAQPVEIAKGQWGKRSKMIFSRFFIVFQNTITIMLLVAAITMTSQTLYLIHAPLGYNTTNIIDQWTLIFDTRESIFTFVNETKQLACVKRVALAQGTPFNGGNNWSMEYEGKNISYQVLRGDSSYFEMFGLQKIRDNHLGSPGVYLNRQALKENELSEDAPELKLGRETVPIAGIIQDFQVGNITRTLPPVLFYYETFEQEYPWEVLIEVQGDPFTAYKQVQAVYERITKVDFEGKFIDRQVEESFASQKRTSTIVIIFTVVAVLISLLGLIAMSTYFVRQRSKEIAMRKVHGAKRTGILMKMVFAFLSYVLIAFVIAVPVIRHFMMQWLSGYSCRIRLSPLLFIAAGAFCLLVSFVSVYWQSRAAANANPVKYLKNE